MFRQKLRNFTIRLPREKIRHIERLLPLIGLIVFHIFEEVSLSVACKEGVLPAVGIVGSSLLNEGLEHCFHPPPLGRPPFPSINPPLLFDQLPDPPIEPRWVRGPSV